MDDTVIHSTRFLYPEAILTIRFLINENNGIDMRALWNTRDQLRKDLLPIVRWCKKRFDAGHLSDAAGQISYTIIFSLVPMITIILAIFTMIPLFKDFQIGLGNYFSEEMMPRKISDTVMTHLNTFAENAGKVSLISACGLLIAIFASLAALEKAFNRIWNIMATRSLLTRIALYLCIGTAGPLVLGVSIYLTSHVILSEHGLVSYIPFFNIFSPFLSGIWMIFAFTLLYRVLPNRQVLWKDALAGSVFAAIAFEIGLRIFAFLMTRSDLYEKIYGALAVFPIFIIWIYTSCFIILLGGFVAAIIPELRNGTWRKDMFLGKNFTEALQIIHLLSKKTEESKYLSQIQVEQMTRIDAHEVEYCLTTLEHAGWIFVSKPSLWSVFIPSQQTKQLWHWKGDLKTITLTDVFHQFVFTPKNNDVLTQRIEGILQQELDITLAEYFSSPYAITSKLPTRSTDSY